MNDLISRRVAIEAIKEDKIDLTNPNVVTVFKATGDFEKVETQVMTCDRHIKILKNIPPAQQWVPISERPPEVKEWVLCQCRAGIIDVLRLTEDGSWDKNYPHAEYMSDFVIAWMLLPEPYQEVSE